MSKLKVNSSPHIHAADTTKGIMMDVIIALMPATVFGIIIFGWRAAVMIAVCIASCVLFEFVSGKLLHTNANIKDLSAVVTGLLIALNMPSRLPVWMAIIGCFAAIVVVKQLFGGLGSNFVNPAIAARIILIFSFPQAMTVSENYAPTFAGAVTTVTGATPLADSSYSYTELLFGNHGGCIGEISVLFLAVGGLYLIIRRVISPTIPLFFIGTVALGALISGGDPIYAVCSGGLMLGAIFMATDYVTSPITFIGKILFGIGCGIITVIVRSGAAAEGVSFAILFMNLLVPHLDNIFKRKPFGWEAKKQ